jgi:hypothetical protein
MEKRVRLTQRTAVDGSIPYPGNVNQPDRQFKDHKQYDNWAEVVDHPLQNPATDWKSDSHDEIGFGVPEDWDQPKMASIHLAADKAVRASVLLLGEKVAELTIEDQARDFMLMGGDALDRTLERFRSTQDLYAATEEAEEEEEEVTEEVEASDFSAEEENSDDNQEEEKEASEEVTEEEVTESEVEASEEIEIEASIGPNEMDIELQAASDDIQPDAQVEALLAGLFDADNAELTQEREASEKQGIKTLGGQPKIASVSSDSSELSNLWESAPDVNHIFK